MPIQLTCCPHCDTRFRITAAQLDIAKGAVRCGHCQGVFQASDYLLDASEIDASEINASGIDTAGRDKPAVKQTSDSREDQQKAPQTTPPSYPVQPDSASADTAPVDTTSAETPQKTTAFDQVNDNQINDPELLKAALVEAGSLKNSQSESKAVVTSYKHPAALLRQTAGGRSHSPLASRWPWFVGSLLAILGLLTQLHLLYFDQLSRLPQWRSHYQQVCSVLGCQLPSVQNIALIESQHLIVRPHPDYEQALTIDALLVNQASWPQPFPDVLFEFRDIEGITLAARSFKPKEYLATSTQDHLAAEPLDTVFPADADNHHQHMPVAVPVHISWEIIRPDAAATAYELIPISNIE